LGYSVSLSSDGMTVAIGAPDKGRYNVESGHVHVYEFLNDSWIQKGGEIRGNFLFDWFGGSVSLSSDGMTVAIGDSYGVNGTDIKYGKVLVYIFVDNSWVQRGGEIYGKFAHENCGASVRLSSDGMTVAIGGLLNHTNRYPYNYTNYFRVYG